MSVAAKVVRAVPGLMASDAPVDRLAYGRDLWPRHHLLVRDGRVAEHTRPSTIVWPTSTEQVAAVLRFCAEEGVPIVPYGAGSGVCGGILPDTSTMVLDLKRMAAVRRLDPAQPSLEVEAGAMGITLEEQLQRQGWTIGHFPSSILCSTVGGWLAARGAGQCSGRYGKIEDMVASIELVDGRGEIHQLHRRPHGLDLTPLIIGSEGTLGAITSCTLRLHPNPTVRAFQAFSFPSTEAGWEALRHLFQRGLRPAVSRLYDPFDSLLARQGSVRTKERNVTGDGHPALGKVLRLPRVLNAIVDTVVDRAMGGSTLILIFEGNGQEPHEDAALAAKIAHERGGVALGEGPARKWLQHRYSVSYRQAPVFRSGAFSDTFEIAAPWSRFKALYDGVRRALSERVFVMAHLSHAYPDGCSVYFSFAGSAATDAEALRLYDETWSSAMQAALEAGGTISHHHGVGRSKAPRLGEELGRGIEVVQSLMRAFDPAAVLNRGNLLPREKSGPMRLPALPRGFTIDEPSSLATIPAAMTLREVRERLAPAGWSLPLVTATDEDRSVGAWIEGGAPGSFDPWLDPCDHLLAGLRAVLPSGEELQIRPCPRRAAGPDLIALFSGASGRFGRVEQVDLRIRAVGEPTARRLPFAGPRAQPLTAGETTMIERIRSALLEGISRRCGKRLTPRPPLHLRGRGGGEERGNVGGFLLLSPPLPRRRRGGRGVRRSHLFEIPSKALGGGWSGAGGAARPGETMKAKELVRERFREQVFKRARFRCEACGAVSSPQRAREELDAHHITDRNEMPAGGYVAENGIALCKPCHELAERFHSTGVAPEGWYPEDLYKRIRSSHDAALLASRRLEAQGR